MFEFREIKNTGENQPTHHVYFKGKLFAKKAYRYRDGFYYDDNVELSKDDFMSLSFSALPDNFYLYQTDKNLYKEFVFGGAERKGDWLQFDFWLEILQPDSTVDMLGFIYFFILLVKTNPFLSSNIDDINLDVHYKCKPTGIVGEAYKMAVAELVRVCRMAEAKVKETELLFSVNKN
ncbi:MAG: hypothetical protein HY063_08090 [Bacteroidetes bacterium]|nr:hypothetical protein [Bacteroidota bacterium]